MRDSLRLGSKHSLQTRLKLSKSLTGRKLSFSHRKAISKYQKGSKRIFTKKWCKNISKAQKGRILSESCRKSMREAYVKNPKLRILKRKLMLKLIKEGKIKKFSKTLKKRFTGDSLVKHHKYGHCFNDIIVVTRRYHKKIHCEAYFYLLEKYGKKAIDKYLIWLKRKENEG